MGVNVDHAFPSRKRSVAANLTQPECEHSPPFESHQGLEVAELPATPMSIETPCSEGATANETPRYLFSETLKKSLWDSYVVYVHPLFPIIDVTTRQEEPIGYFIRQGNERLSPLVFLFHTIFGCASCEYGVPGGRGLRVPGRARCGHSERFQGVFLFKPSMEYSH